MKKFVIFSLFAFLILAFGTIVYGQEKPPVLEFKASGWIDMSSEWKYNVPEAGSGDTNNDAFYGPAVSVDYATGLGTYLPGGTSFDRHEAWMRSRGRLKFEAIMGKEMTGTFQFEIDATNWGSADGTRNRAGYWLADRAAVEVKHMYITFGMPWVPIPITIQAGVQPIAVRPNVNLYNDGPGITVAAKIDPALIKLMWFKQWEGKNAAADDMDIYGLDANFKLETLTLGGYALYYNMNSYPLNAPSAPLYSSEMWWAGLYADGKLGPINLTLDFGLDSGKVKDRVDVGPRAKDVDYSGWMFRGEASYPWEKFTFGGVFSYGTGADVNKTWWTGLPGTFSPNTGAATSKVGAYAFAPGSEGGPGDLFIVQANGSFDRGISGMLVAPGNGMARNCYGGIWYAKLYAAMKVTDMWKVTLGAAYVGDTTKHGNTLGDAIKDDGSGFRDDSYIGIEFDLLNQFQLYKNLTWDVGFGYLAAGDGLDYADVPGSLAAGAIVNTGPKNPYALVTRLVYSF